MRVRVRKDMGPLEGDSTCFVFDKHDVLRELKAPLELLVATHAPFKAPLSNPIAIDVERVIQQDVPIFGSFPPPDN